VLTHSAFYNKNGSVIFRSGFGAKLGVLKGFEKKKVRQVLRAHGGVPIEVTINGETVKVWKLPETELFSQSQADYTEYGEIYEGDEEAYEGDD
jgi:hypothetical protein